MAIPVEAVALLAAGLVVVVAVRTTAPNRLTVLAAGPWTVTAALAVVAADAGAYDALAVDPTPVTVTALVTALAAGTWAGCAELARLRGLPYRDRYLAATGIAAGTVLGGTLLVDATFAPQSLVWLVIAPVVAGVLAALGYFVLGLIYTDALAELQLGGLYAVAVVVFDATASAVVVEQLGGTETAVLTTGIVRVAEAAGLDPWTWALVPAHLGVGMAFVAACGWAGRKRHDVGAVCALVGSVVVLWSAAVVLLSAALLG